MNKKKIAFRIALVLALCIALEIDLLKTLAYLFFLFSLGFPLKLKREGDIILYGKFVKYVVFLKDEAHEGVSVAVKITSRKSPA